MTLSSLIGPQTRLISWFSQNHRTLPWRTSPWGSPRNPWLTWISEIMLQQTQVATVIEKFLFWKKHYPTPQHLAQATEENVLQDWQGLGYYRRARNLHRAAQHVVTQYQGQVPPDRQALLKLPGVGDYTAGAILSLAYQQPEPILDGNLIRIFSRLHRWKHLPAESASIKKKYWQEAFAWAQHPTPHLVNEGLMELGALICTPKNPVCSQCPLALDCVAFQKQQVEHFPPLAQRKPSQLWKGTLLWIQHQNQVLLVKNDHGFLTQQWKLPLIEGPPQQAHKWLQTFWPQIQGQHLGAIRHQITHHRMQLQVFQYKVPHSQLPQDASQQYRWLPLKEFATFLPNQLSLKALGLLQR